MTATKHKPRKIKLSIPSTEPKAKGPPPPKPETRWAAEDDVARETAPSVYQDTRDPSRFHRRGRGGQPARVVRRVTIYLSDELTKEMDRWIAEHPSENRSTVLEAALARFLSAPVDQ